MIIYLITNKINDKKYVGQTRSTIKKRINQHCEKRNKTVIGNAIKKYGKQNFDVEIVAEGSFLQEETNNLEIEYIKRYNSIVPYGYNVETGGNASPMPLYVKQKISNKLKGRKIIWGNKISNGVKKLWENEEYRNRQTEQRRQKRGKYREGIKKDKLKVKINTIEFKKDYENGVKIKDLVLKYDISVPTIYRLIKELNICKRR